MEYELSKNWRLNGALITNDDGTRIQNVWVSFRVKGDLQNCSREESIQVQLTSDSISEGILQINSAVNAYIESLKTT